MNKAIVKLQELLRDNMSPQAVALMIAHLQTCDTHKGPAAKEVAWFVEVLTETVGGVDAVNDLFEEVGV